MDEKAARKVALNIAHRAAMRVFPIAWEWYASAAARKLDLTALPVLRSNLMSGVASTCPTPEISRAAHAAAFAAAANAADAWDQIVRDVALLEAGHDLSTNKLWAETPAVGFQTVEDPMLEAWKRAPDTWRFWARRWTGATRAEPLNWDLQTKVALIEDEEWAQGPEHIARVIGGIETEFAVERTKLGETLDVNPETGLLYLSDDQCDKATVCAAASAKLNKMDEMLSQYDNYVGALRGELFLIRRAVAHHSTNPIILHNNAKAARRLLAGNVANGNCPSLASEPVLELFDATLLDVQMSLQDEPSVVEANAHRPEFSEIANDAEVQRLARDAAREIAENAEGRLAIEIVEDAEIVADASQSEVLRAASADALASRSLRVWVAARVAQARKAIKISAEFTKDATIVVGGASGIGIGSLALWDRVYGTTYLPELIQRILTLLA
ncbi:hypothetical protein [Planktotalea sp.]|uniref:hypothetical protein n=1 Tax=Planktotalea sp. TaxID=2029877 RepID=UPI0035C79FEC